MESATAPLDYLLGIMRDEDQDARSRLDAAKAAAPYRHARLSSTELSGPNGSPVEVQTTQKIDISDLSDEDLDILGRPRYIGTCASEDDRGAGGAISSPRQQLRPRLQAGAARLNPRFCLCSLWVPPLSAAETVTEKIGVNSALGIALKTQDFVTEAAVSDMTEIAAAANIAPKG